MLTQKNTRILFIIGITIAMTYCQGPTTDNFSWMEKATQCPSLAKAKWQGPCASDWAISVAVATEVAICIKEPKLAAMKISYTDPLCYCKKCHAVEGNGCMGGSAKAAIDYFRSEGIVGGSVFGWVETTPDFSAVSAASDGPKMFKNCMNYFSKECYPYAITGGEKCGANQPTQFDPLKFCTGKCTHSVYKDNLVKDQRWKRLISDYKHMTTVTDMISKLKEYGPIIGFMEVYEDIFMNDGTELYIHTVGQSVGYHSVVIVGYGVDATTGLKFWEVLLPFGKEIGKGGIVKVYKGVNHCNIEERAYAMLVRTSW